MMADQQDKGSANGLSIRGVILDVDGTLVDSNEAHARAWYEVLQAHDINTPYEKIRRLIGMGGDNFLPTAANIEKDSPLGKKIAQERSEHFKQVYLPKLKPFPHVVDLLKRMKTAGLHLVVGSSSEEDELKALLKIAGAVPYLEAQVSSGDVDRSKPDPDIVHTALHKLGFKPHEVVLIGDTPYDIEAASKAGVQTIAFRCGGFSAKDLKDAIAIYDNPSDLLAHYQDSPLNTKRYEAHVS